TRIAKGSGTEIGRVNAVLKQYENMKEMFKKVGDFAKKQNGGRPVGSNYTPPKDKKKKKKH
ncbi:MAG: signal recognition particle protein, partial [Fibrobacter sp.]|nr:signal recognition particle protein [Fibrobacter sp.]